MGDDGRYLVESDADDGMGARRSGGCFGLA